MNDSMFIPLDDNHYPEAQHGDVVSGKIHEDDDGSRWLQSIPTAKDSGIKSEDIKTAQAYTPPKASAGGKDASLEDQAASLMNSIKKYNKSYYSDEED